MSLQTSKTTRLTSSNLLAVDPVINKPYYVGVIMLLLISGLWMHEELILRHKVCSDLVIDMNLRWSSEFYSSKYLSQNLNLQYFYSNVADRQIQRHTDVVVFFFYQGMKQLDVLHLMLIF